MISILISLILCSLGNSPEILSHYVWFSNNLWKSHCNSNFPGQEIMCQRANSPRTVTGRIRLKPVSSDSKWNIGFVWSQGGWLGPSHQQKLLRRKQLLRWSWRPRRWQAWVKLLGYRTVESGETPPCWRGYSLLSSRWLWKPWQPNLILFFERSWKFN